MRNYPVCRRVGPIFNLDVILLHKKACPCVALKEGTLNMNKTIITIVDAPEVTLEEHDKAGDVLLKFYSALGWNGEDFLDPSKIRTTKAVFDGLYNIMFEKVPDPVSVGMLMCNSGPGTDERIPPGKVVLLEGWVKPTPEKGNDNNGHQQQTV
jgi:hypothetical protein